MHLRRLFCGLKIEIPRVPFAEEHSNDFVPTNNPRHFPESKEWNESAKYDKTVSDRFVSVHARELLPHSEESLRLPKSTHQMSDKFKRSHAYGKNSGFIKGGENQWLVFQPSPKMQSIDKKDEFSQDHRFNDGSSVTRVANGIVREYKSSVVREHTEEYGEV
jgi:hypothetical protein